MDLYASVPDDTLPRSVQNGWIDRFAVWAVDSGGPKSTSSTPPGEYDWPFVIIRPHRSTTYVDAAYCYRPIEGGLLVCLSVGLFVAIVSPAKTAEPIDFLFELWTRVGRRKHNFNRIRQVAPMCPHGRYTGATWRIRLNSPSAPTMRTVCSVLIYV